MKISSLHHLHQASGAIFADHHGWAVPASFARAANAELEETRTTCGLADLSYRVKYRSRIDPGGVALRLSTHNYLLLGEPGLPPPVQSVDVTSVYANLLLAGPHSRRVLRKLTSLNLTEARMPNLACGQASLAHVHSIVHREDLGPLPAFHILTGREYAESVWEAILHAGGEFDIAPFGQQALELLRN